MRTLVRDAATRLLEVHADDDLDEARLEAELLLGEATGWTRAQVLARATDQPDEDATARFDGLLRRRLAHEPLAYILGEREFFGLSYEVGPGVLIPRPSTETLVEATLTAIREHPNARRIVRVADIGAGCGTVAMALAAHAPHAKVWATDPSTAALAVAGRNRERFGLRDRVILLAGSLTEALPEPVDVLAANLPYIPTEELAHLAPEIRDWEPRDALDGGPDGLEVVRALIAELPGALSEGAVAVLLEVGEGQAEWVAELLAKTISGEVTVHRDFGRIERVVEGRRGYPAG